MIQFHVDGEPKGQPRPRAFARKMGNKFVARVYDCGSAEGWKSSIAVAAKPFIPAQPIDTPVVLSICFYLPRPQRLCRKKDNPGMLPATCKPDLDNFAKAVMDALTVIGMWVDDALVSQLNVRKLYHAVGSKPGAYVSIDTETLGCR